MTCWPRSHPGKNDNTLFATLEYEKRLKGIVRTMATKKEKKARQMQAKKNKQKKRMGILGVIIAVCVGFLIFFFVTLFDSLFPPIGDKTSRTATQEKEQMVLYFADANERFLVPEKRYIPKRADMGKQAEELVRALIEGSNTGGGRTIPAQSELIDITAKRDVIVVDFGRSLIDLHPGSSASEMITLYSVANTIIKNIPSLKQVSFRIEGKTTATLKGHIDTTSPFVFNEELIIGENG